MIEMSRELINSYRNVRLFVDTMHTSKISFLCAILEQIDSKTSSYLKFELKVLLLTAIEKVIKMHRDRGFKVKCTDVSMRR